MVAGPPTLVVDVGGTALKGVVLDERGVPVGATVRRRTPYPCPPLRLLDEIAALSVELPPASRVSLGFPGLLRSGRVVQVNPLMRAEPDGPQDPGLVQAWRGVDVQVLVADRLGLPTRVANDADVAALASVSGRGLECVLTLGTGLGSSLVQDGVLLPHIELGGAPFRDGQDFEAVLGNAGLTGAGRAAWTGAVADAVAALRRVLYFDRLYLGGGNARLLAGVELGADVHIVSNANGLLGGHYLWGSSRVD